MVTQRHGRPAIQYSCPNHVRGSFNDHWRNRRRRQCTSKRPFQGALFISRTLSSSPTACSYVTSNIFADYLLCNSRRHHRLPRLLVRWSLLISFVPVPGKLLLIHFRLSQIVWNHFLRPHVPPTIEPLSRFLDFCKRQWVEHVLPMFTTNFSTTMALLITGQQEVLQQKQFISIIVSSINKNSLKQV